MQRRAKTRIGVAALTVVYSLLAFPLTAHANPGVGYIPDGIANYGSSGSCDETGEGGAWGSTDNHGNYAFGDHGYYALNSDVAAGTTSGYSEGVLSLCGEMSRQPRGDLVALVDDPVGVAVGAVCEVTGPGPTGSNGYGRITYDYGPLAGHHIQLSNVRMSFTIFGIIFTGEYSSSPGMPNASTGTALIYAYSHNDCLNGGNLRGHSVFGSVALIPDVA
jgi:hypothetical protein